MGVYCSKVRADPLQSGYIIVMGEIRLEIGP